MTPRTELDRLFADSLAKIPTPESPMKIDLGHPLQDHDEPKPFDFTLTPAERDRAKLVSIDLERQLGVVFTDGDAA